ADYVINGGSTEMVIYCMAGLARCMLESDNDVDVVSHVRDLTAHERARLERIRYTDPEWAQTPSDEATKISHHIDADMLNDTATKEKLIFWAMRFVQDEQFDPRTAEKKAAGWPMSDRELAQEASGRVCTIWEVNLFSLVLRRIADERWRRIEPLIKANKAAK